MTYYNLINQIKALLLRLEVKIETQIVLSTVTWYNLPAKLREITTVLISYQSTALDGDLQDIIDDLEVINWFSVLNSTKKIKEAIVLIETL